MYVWYLRKQVYIVCSALLNAPLMVLASRLGSSEEVTRSTVTLSINTTLEEYDRPTRPDRPVNWYSVFSELQRANSASMMMFENGKFVP